MKYVLLSIGGDGCTYTTETPICVFTDQGLARKVSDTLMEMRNKKRSKVSKNLSFSVCEVPDVTDSLGSDANWIAKTLANQGLCQ